MVGSRWLGLAVLMLVVGGCQSGRIVTQPAHVQAPAAAAPSSESSEVLSTRFKNAAARGDSDETLIALTALVRRSPEVASTLNPSLIRHLTRHEPTNAREHDIRLQALNALFDASYKMEDGIEASALWVMLVQELVARGDLDRAGAVVSRVDSPHLVVWMRVDRRFDALVRKYPKQFDFQAAADRMVAGLETAVKTHPRSMDAVVQLTYGYMYVGRYADVLSETDTVLGNIVMSGGVDVLYDSAESLRWIYDNRADAFSAMGRWDEAEAERRRAANRLDNGRKNVDNTLNLAEFYSNREQPQDALATLRELPTEANAMSAFGRMVEYDVRVNAAVSMHDDAEVSHCLTYLREHRADNPLALQKALLRVNATDEVAQMLIARLRNPSQRQGALFDVQIFANPPDSPAVEQDRARLQQIIARREVRAAINAVGRRERFSLPPL